jgi:3-deoxy-D-manno-octulosonic-acid transferase
MNEEALAQSGLLNQKKETRRNKGYKNLKQSRVFVVLSSHQTEAQVIHSVHKQLHGVLLKS